MSQANSVATSQAQMHQGVQGQSQQIPERLTIWEGLLEWSEKTKDVAVPQIFKKQVPFRVLANSKDGEPVLKAEGWPQTFKMQFTSKQPNGNIDIGGDYSRTSNRLVFFHPQPCEDLQSLTRVMSAGLTGCTRFVTSVPPCELKVLILLYNVNKNIFIGMILNDQVALQTSKEQMLQSVNTTLGPTAAASFSLATSINNSTTATNTSQMVSLCTSVNTITATPGPVAAATPAKVPRYDFSDASFSLATSSGKIKQTGNVILMEDEPSTSAPIPVELKMNPNINWDILSEMECPVCLDYMLAPIYQCTNGHSICKPCKAQLTQCPTCRYKFLEAKNVVLDKITQHIIYPCKFYKSGCQYSSKSIKIRNHENRCEFKPYKCPLKFEKNCDWNGSYTEMVVHIDNHHDEAILKTDNIDLAFDENKQLKKIILIKYLHNIFKLFFKYNKKKRFYWGAQLVGPENDAQLYKFEVDIIDLTPAKKRWCFTNLVVPLADTEDHFINEMQCTVCFLKQLKDFTTDSFSFKVRVIE